VIEKLRVLRLTTAAELVETAVEETLAYYAFPEEHWRRIRTTDEIDKQFFCELGDFAEIASGPFFCSAMPRPFFRPGRRSVSRRAQGLSRLAASAATTGLALTAPSTVAG
jgi:putative transposase